MRQSVARPSAIHPGSAEDGFLLTAMGDNVPEGGRLMVRRVGVIRFVLGVGTPCICIRRQVDHFMELMVMSAVQDEVVDAKTSAEEPPVAVYPS